MSLKIGGDYFCGQCQKTFESSDKWIKHREDGKHTICGQEQCVLCKTVVDYKNHTQGRAVLYDKCKKDLVK